MFFKKSFFVVGLFLLSLFSVPSGQAEIFAPYKAPHIKNDFCGKAMSAYNCKCAWHGQYCDKIGMTQAQAASYVTNEFHKWAAPHKLLAKTACEDTFKINNIWTGSGCLTCEPQKREIPLNGKCRSISDLCSDDPNVRYTTKGTCECKNGGVLTKEKRCETPCDSNDPNLVYDKKSEECVCKKGFMFYDDICVDECGNDPNIMKSLLSGVCGCAPGTGVLVGEAPHYECTNDCGDDPHIFYDENFSQCVCDEGFQRTNDDAGFACEETVDANVNITFPGTKPPLVADGTSSFPIHITVQNPQEQKGIKAHFKLKSGTGHAVGKIVQTEENEVGDYTITYQPPALATGIDSASDYLFIYFHSPKEDKEIYKTHEIDLVSGMPIVIKKEGFVDQESAVVFYTPESKVTVYTKTEDGQKVPVQEAQVGIKGRIGTEPTNDEGEILLSSPNETSGTEMAEIEVFLEMTSEMKEIQKEANAQYRQIVQGKMGITNSTVKDFIQKFEKHLAQAPEEKVENMVIGLRRAGYALLYMTEGRELSDDIAKEVGASVKNQISDTLDLMGASDKINDKLKAKISTEKLEGVSTQLQEKLTSLTPNINKKLNELTGKFQNGVMNVLKSGIKKYAPKFQDDWTDEILGQFFSNPLEDYSKESLIEKATEKAQNWTQDKIEEYIVEFLQTKYDAMLRLQMKELAEMIDQKRFNVGAFETNRQNAKESFTELRAQYMQAHEVSFNVSFIKDSADLFNNTIGEAGKITGFWKAQAEAIETACKAFRSGVLNNVEIFYWFRGYGDFYYDVEQNINEALGIAYLPQEGEVNTWSFFPVAHGEVSLDLEAESMNLTFAEDTLSLMEGMEEINTLFSEIYPEDENLKEVQTLIESQKPELQNTIESISPLVNEYRKTENKKQNELDEDGDGEVTFADITIGEWIMFGVLVLVGWFIISGIIKITRKIKS